MAQNQRTRAKRENERALANAERKGHYAAAGAPGGASIPSDIRALSRAINARRLGDRGNLYADVRVGGGMDDFTKARNLLVKGIPPAEITNRFGESRRPQFAGEVTR